MAALEVGVECGKCGGPVYMETCRQNTGTDHDWVVASECQRCGERHPVKCPDCTSIDEGDNA